jgi:hypothetical protein
LNPSNDRYGGSGWAALASASAWLYGKNWWGPDSRPTAAKVGKQSFGRTAGTTAALSGRPIDSGELIGVFTSSPRVTLMVLAIGVIGKRWPVYDAG